MFKKPFFLVSESSTPASVVHFSALSLRQVRSFLNYVSLNLLIADVWAVCQVICLVFWSKFSPVFLLCFSMVKAKADLMQPSSVNAETRLITKTAYSESIAWKLSALGLLLSWKLYWEEKKMNKKERGGKKSIGWKRSLFMQLVWG